MRKKTKVVNLVLGPKLHFEHFDRNRIYFKSKGEGLLPASFTSVPNISLEDNSG